MVQRLLIVAGVVLLALGLLWPHLDKIPLGRLPGDIYVERPNMKFYFPITTMVLVSVLASLLLSFFRK